MVTAQSAAMMYYIFVYCELTALLPLIDKLGRSRFRLLGFLISPIEMVLCRTMPLVLGITLPRALTTIIRISCIGWIDYYYLGYLIRNDLLEYKKRRITYVFLIGIFIILQIVEGYWMFSNYGYLNAGTQLKLSSFGYITVICLLTYDFLISYKKINRLILLKGIGDKSFGIYFCHIAVMSILGQLPYYSEYFVYPLNALATVAISYICVVVGK